MRLLGILPFISECQYIGEKNYALIARASYAHQFINYKHYKPKQIPAYFTPSIFSLPFHLSPFSLIPVYFPFIYTSDLSIQLFPSLPTQNDTVFQYTK